MTESLGLLIIVGEGLPRRESKRNSQRNKERKLMEPVGLDVYGTLVDPLSIADALRETADVRAGAAATLWRQKQVEYAFRRAAMRTFVPFEVCAQQALDFVVAKLAIPLSLAGRERVLESLRRLPAYPDVRGGLLRMRAEDRPCVAFSNGSTDVLRETLEAAGLLELLDDVVSVAEVGTLKPDPVVYRHLAARLDTDARNVWLVSGNGWDVLGAKSAGLRGAWLDRSGQEVFDPWGVSPDIAGRDLQEVAERISQASEPHADG
jgi:2-haloacid dehalogenase